MTSFNISSFFALPQLWEAGVRGGVCAERVSIYYLFTAKNENLSRFNQANKG